MASHSKQWQFVLNETELLSPCDAFKAKPTQAESVTSNSLPLPFTVCC